MDITVRPGIGLDESYNVIIQKVTNGLRSEIKKIDIDKELSDSIALGEEFVPGGMEIRKKVLALQRALYSLPVADFPVRHWFAEGTYCREMKIPAGHVIVGRIHKFSCTNIIVQGRVTLTSPDEEVVCVDSPYIFTSPPGSKRAVFAVTDTIWITVHHTYETDPEKLWDIFTVDTIEEYEKFIKGQVNL